MHELQRKSILNRPAGTRPTAKKSVRIGAGGIHYGQLWSSSGSSVPPTGSTPSGSTPGEPTSSPDPNAGQPGGAQELRKDGTPSQDSVSTDDRADKEK